MVPYFCFRRERRIYGERNIYNMLNGILTCKESSPSYMESCGEPTQLVGSPEGLGVWASYAIALRLLVPIGSLGGPGEMGHRVSVTVGGKV